jgi:hypothetical protein
MEIGEVGVQKGKSDERVTESKTRQKVSTHFLAIIIELFAYL